MGAKSSKKSVLWPSEPRVFDGSLADLSGTAVNAQNSLGLPDDVLGLIVVLLDVKEVGRLALVCKSWRCASLSLFLFVFSSLFLCRRASLKEWVWRRLALEMGIVSVEVGPVRSVVIENTTAQLDCDFMYVPDQPFDRLKEGSKCCGGNVNIFLTNGFGREVIFFFFRFPLSRTTGWQRQVFSCNCSCLRSFPR